MCPNFGVPAIVVTDEPIDTVNEDVIDRRMLLKVAKQFLESRPADLFG